MRDSSILLLSYAVVFGAGYALRAYISRRRRRRYELLVGDYGDDEPRRPQERRRPHAPRAFAIRLFRQRMN